MSFRKTGDVVPIGLPLDKDELKKRSEVEVPKPIKIVEKKDEAK